MLIESVYIYDHKRKLHSQETSRPLQAILGRSRETSHSFIMKDLQKRCKIMSLERKCTDGVERLRTALEVQLHNGISSIDIWDRTVSFFSVKKTLLIHNGYSKYSRDTLRLFPSSAEDVAPLCVQ